MGDTALVNVQKSWFIDGSFLITNGRKAIDWQISVMKFKIVGKSSPINTIASTPPRKATLDPIALRKFRCNIVLAKLVEEGFNLKRSLNLLS
jgi:hypothetical protein